VRGKWWWLGGGVAALLVVSGTAVVLSTVQFGAAPRPRIQLHKIGEPGEQDRFVAASKVVGQLPGADPTAALLPGATEAGLTTLVPRGSTVKPDGPSWHRSGRVAAVNATVTTGGVGKPVRVIMVVTDDGWRVLQVLPPDASVDTPPQPVTSSPAPSQPPAKPTLAGSQCPGVQVVKAGKPGSVPVLLVPGPDGVAGLVASQGTTGIAGTTGLDSSLVGRFADISGVTAYVLSAGDPSQWVGDRSGSGPAVADAIDCLHKGGAKVAVVGVSTGGLAVKWALTDASGAKDRAAAIGVVATLGTPYGGAYAVTVARALRSDDPTSLPDLDAATARRAGLVLKAAMADLAVCPDAGGPSQHTQPACRRLDVLAALAGPLGDALKPDALPAWPSSVPVLQIAGRAQLTDQHVDLGDGIATTDSALSGATRSTIHTCSLTTAGGAKPTPCWNSDLAVQTEVVDDAVGVVRALAHPTVTGFRGSSLVGYMENGQVGGTLPGGVGDFTADGRYLVGNSDTTLTILDTQTGQQKTATCACESVGVVGRQVYAYSKKGSTAFTVPDLKVRPVDLGPLGDARSFVTFKASRGEQLLVEVLDSPGAHNGTSSLIAIGPGGVRSKVVQLKEGGTRDIYADPYDPNGPVVATQNSQVSACEFYDRAFLVNFASGTSKVVDGSGFGTPTEAQLQHGTKEIVSSTTLEDVHRGGDGRVYASASSGSCDEGSNPSVEVPQSLWRLDGARWVSVDAGPIAGERTFGAAGRITLTPVDSTDRDLHWKRGAVSSTYDRKVWSLSSPAGQSVFADAALAPPAGKKVSPPKPLVVSPDGVGPLTVGASVQPLLANGTVKLLYTSNAGCRSLQGTGRLAGIYVQLESGSSTIKHLAMEAAWLPTDAGASPNATVAELKRVYGSALKSNQRFPNHAPDYYIERGSNILYFSFNGPPGTNTATGYDFGDRTLILRLIRSGSGGLC
jgi:hypothetical protein